MLVGTRGSGIIVELELELLGESEIVVHNNELSISDSIVVGIPRWRVGEGWVKAALCIVDCVNTTSIKHKLTLFMSM